MKRLSVKSSCSTISKLFSILLPFFFSFFILQLLVNIKPMIRRPIRKITYFSVESFFKIRDNEGDAPYLSLPSPS